MASPTDEQYIRASHAVVQCIRYELDWQAVDDIPSPTVYTRDEGGAWVTALVWVSDIDAIG